MAELGTDQVSQEKEVYENTLLKRERKTINTIVLLGLNPVQEINGTLGEQDGSSENYSRLF